VTTRREEYRRPEERTLADLMVGSRVIVQYMAGPEPDPDDPDQVVRGQPQALTGSFWLHAISGMGIEISHSLTGEGAELFLVPWGNVLVLDGAARGELEEEARGRLVIDRQALLDRLNDARPEDRSLGLDARRYLTYNPHDEEVRGALEGLPKEHLLPP
jgi:hypothetical protein